MQRQDELISGLRKIGLVKAEASLDDVLGLKIEGLLEKRLQTLVFRKGLASTVKQSRQFVTHGHISIGGKRISSPGYIVPVSEAESIGWYRKPIKIENTPKKDMKKEFEESAGQETVKATLEESKNVKISDGSVQAGESQ